MKSEGKRLRFLPTAWFRARASTPYNVARSESSLTFSLLTKNTSRARFSGFKMIAIVLGLAGEFFRGRHKPAKLTEFFISGESKKHDAAGAPSYPLSVIR